MADSDSRAQRAAALEEKRRRLEELKKRRTRRDEDSSLASTGAASTTTAATATTTTTTNLDEYIDGLLNQPSPGVTAATAGTAAATSGLSTHYSTGDGSHGSGGTSAAAAVSASSVSTGTGVDAAIDDNKSIGSNGLNNFIAEPATPSSSAAGLIHKVVETFIVGTQTEAEDFIVKGNGNEVSDDDDADDDDDNNDGGAIRDEDLIKREGAENGGRHENDYGLKKYDENDPKILTTEEIEREVTSFPFSSFINTASKKVERMLGTPLLADLLVDYVGETDNHKRTESKADTDSSKFVTSQQLFLCSKWTEGRDVTDMDWSPLHREFILSTYHTSLSSAAFSPLVKGSAATSSIVPSAMTTLSSSMTPRSGELQADGLALVWNLTMPTRPEHIFTCGSPVTTGRFHPTESTLLVGGCESGQLVVWDVRAGRLPVQKSALSSVVGASNKGHSHPIGCMEIIEGGIGLVTSSRDGKVNFWSLANLREPAESLQVGDGISCFAVAPESETLLLGDDQGTLYAAQASSSSSSSTQSSTQRTLRRQVRKLEPNDREGENLGHYGMITSLSTKTLKKGAATRSAGQSKGFLRGSGGLVLSSGVDWTVKLWAPAYSDRPLLSLVSHTYDYMADVKWSPSHPSLFATASSNGSVGLWNLASSFDDPLTGPDGITVEPDAMSSGRGLSKLRWSLDGRRLAVASLDRIHMLSLAEDVTRTKGDEDTKMMNQLLSRGLVDRQ